MQATCISDRSCPDYSYSYELGTHEVVRDNRTGAFGAAWQLNTLVTYVFSPYAELSKREFAVAATSKNDLKNKVEQALKLMNWITSYFAIFIAFASDWILTIVYGKQYSGAKNITIIIMFYTVYQAWGQITGAYMIATEKQRRMHIYLL